MTLTLCEIARKTLEAYFSGNHNGLDKETKQKFEDERACFVTLEKSGKLRGCIGSLEARQELWRDVQENVINAAFFDPRFYPVKKEELAKIKIEVSVLSKSKKLEFSGEKDLLNKLNHKMGIIIQKGHNSSTFLPQVWEQLPDKTEFLEHLSLKAGLDKDAWKSAEIFYYTVEFEKEE